MERLRVLTAALSSKVVTDSLPTGNYSIPGWPRGLYNATNFKYEESPHPSTTLRVPGLTVESFDIRWQPKLSSIMRASVLARDCALSIPLPQSRDGNQEQAFFMDWPHFTKNFFHFVFATEFVMSRAIHDKNFKKGPMDMKFTLGNIGNSSLALVSKFSGDDGKTGASTPLWTNTVQLVAVDKTTRKPAKLPEWYRSKYKGRGCMDTGLIIKQFKRPDVTYAHPSVVQWSECGRTFKNADWTAYADWAVDALRAALLLQTDTSYVPFSYGAPPGESPTMKARAALRGITSDMVDNGFRKMQAVFLSECLEGEYIETHLWQDDSGEKELVYFSVVKNGKDVCQMKIWFFSDSV
ncbi:hypothetical protein ElyMa_001351300 [Elysia marginata]|uniref:Uncharacterized protein n=1 Tax=Elysia marginata TaxID=1093978 RepID=A0AAV4IPC0_9GAST|nr:hypothetical protein ElyMa_001351300 [Elysia marginata]